MLTQVCSYLVRDSNVKDAAMAALIGARLIWAEQVPAAISRQAHEHFLQVGHRTHGGDSIRIKG